MTMTIRSEPRALVCVAADGHEAERAVECSAYCERRGYQLCCVVVGVHHWDEILDMLLRREVDVVVVPTRDVLPTDRAARLETLTQEYRVDDLAPRRAPHVVTHRRRRTGFIRRGAAG